ncbi:hypothetical protein EJB05_31928 [Eragrostis curvula]|uniref:Uncharacterized protein n=1 Tax=Eragrostis curvula TaxID=38414 RepID=A0A5J9UFN3_9POAL|nr:hypothetical protein EJB05_31928 [Eragrostis curvula]
MLYWSLFDILGRMELSQLEAYHSLQLLFRNHPDLREGLERFRPPVPTKHATTTFGRGFLCVLFHWLQSA